MKRKECPTLIPVWLGASTSKYGDEIEKVAKEGKTPVIIELKIDSRLPENTINVDHHNENASKPASILQVCGLLGAKPTREMQLVAANDSGYIPAMLAMGATKEEVNAIRYKDCACQGITPEQEKQAEEAIAGVREACGATVIKMAHSKISTATDRLFNPDKPQNIAMFSEDGEVIILTNGEIKHQATLLIWNKVFRRTNMISSMMDCQSKIQRLHRFSRNMF